MAQVHWIQQVSGSFTNVGDWSTGMVPGAADDAILNASGLTAYKVTSSTSETVSSIQTASTATLAITGGAFDAANGTGAGVNAGTITVSAGATFANGGVFDNTGTVLLTGGDFVSATVTNTGQIDGYGVVTGALTNLGVVAVQSGHILDMSKATFAKISGGTFVINAGATLQGPDNLGFKNLTVTIDLNGVGSEAQNFNTTTKTQVTIEAGLTGIGSGGAVEVLGGRNYTTTNTIANAGIIQLGGGKVSSGGLTNSGTIEGFGALAGPVADSGTISAQGGLLSLRNTTLRPSAGATFVSNAGSILQTGDNTGFQTLDFTVVLTGSGSQIQSFQTATSTQLTFEQGSTGLSATGVLKVLGGRTYNTANAYANSGTLQLGGGTFTSASLTDAAGSTLTGFGVVASRFSNAGMVIASGGSLSFTGANDSFGGTLSAGLGYRLTFTGKGDSFSGTLSGAGAVAFSGGSDRLSGVTLSVASTVINGAAVTLSGSITNSGVITATTANLIVGASAADSANLSGGGTLALSNLATNRIQGASAAAKLVNVNDKITGAGNLGGGQMTLVNQAGGIINGNQTLGLTLNTGANTIANAGIIENTGAGGTTIASAVNNTGTLMVTKGLLWVNGAVTGAGTAKIAGGTADFASTFSENVAFTSTTGVLELAHSRTYIGQITGFSHTGTTSLDLLDIAFTSGVTKATYSGTTTSGVLTVTDGTNSAHFHLSGNYVGSTFIASSDGHGGVLIKDPTAPSGPAALTQALASFQHGLAPHDAGMSRYQLPNLPIFHALA